eukprot:g3687.t1
MPRRRPKGRIFSPRKDEVATAVLDPGTLVSGFEGDPYYAQRASIFQSIHTACRGVITKPYHSKVEDDVVTKKKKQMNASKNATGYGNDVAVKKKRSKRNSYMTNAEVSDLFKEVGLSEVDLEKIEKERKRRAAAVARARKKKYEATLADPSGSPVQRLNWIVKIMTPYTSISPPVANTTSQLAMRLLVDLCGGKNHCGMLVKRNVLPFLLALTVCSHETVQVKSFVALREYLSQLYRLPDWSRYLSDFMCSRLISAIVEHLLDAFSTANSSPKINRGRIAALLQDRDLYPCIPVCLNLFCIIISEMIIDVKNRKFKSMSQTTLSASQRSVYRKLFVKNGGLFAVVLFMHCGGRISRNAFEPYMPFLNLSWIDEILDEEGEEFCLPESMRMSKQWTLILQSMHEESTKRGERSFIPGEEKASKTTEVHIKKEFVKDDFIQATEDSSNPNENVLLGNEYTTTKESNQKEDTVIRHDAQFESKTSLNVLARANEQVQATASFATDEPKTKTVPRFDASEARRRAMKRIKAKSKTSRTRRLLSKADRRILQSLLKGTNINDEGGDTDQAIKPAPQPKSPISKFTRNYRSKYEAQLEKIYGDGGSGSTSNGYKAKQKTIPYGKSGAILQKCLQVARQDRSSSSSKDNQKHETITVGGLPILVKNKN